MKNLLFIVCVLLATSANAAKPLYTIYTGSPKGTYHQIADDIVKACPQFEIQVESTQGSLDNINALISTPVFKNGHRFALVQKDALEAIIGSEPRAGQLYKKVGALFSEEITILVSKQSGIKTLADLNGKQVSIGQSGSGSWFTANILKTTLGLKWAPYERSLEETMLYVLTGQIDAAVVVGGTPFRILDELGSKIADRIFILPVTDPRMFEIYDQAIIQRGTYPWIPEEVKTISTSSILVAATDVPDADINAMTGCITKNLPSIKKTGHKKWMEVKASSMKTRGN